MTVIEYVRDFIQTFPELNAFRKAVNVDHLGEEKGSYAIEPIPASPILKKYLDGSSKRQLIFNFCSRDYIGPDVLENLDNIAFFEKFQAWLEESTNMKKLPDMGEGRYPIKMEATTSGYNFNADIGKGVYQIQCKFIYFQEV